MQNSIQPWLTVHNSKKALEFYIKAFDAVATYQLDTSDENVIARLAVNGAEFWIADESPDFKNFSPQTIGGITVRMILITTEPEYYFTKAIIAGAVEVFPIGIDHGWKLGRIEDPFGHHWEIGHPVEE